MMINLNLILIKMVMMKKNNKPVRKKNGLSSENLQFIGFRLKILLKQLVLYIFQKDYFNSIWLINLSNKKQVNSTDIEKISKNLDIKQ